jgi:hypothetical protein
MTMVSHLLNFKNCAMTATAVRIAIATVILNLVTATTVGAKTYDINITNKRGIQQRIVARFEHDGDIFVAGTQPNERAKQLPMKTIATMTYFQRLTGSDKDPQAIRFFENSKGNFNIEKGKVDSSVAEKNRIVVARLKSIPGQRLQMASVMNALSQAEYELIKNPADPLTYKNLLEKKGVAIGDKWKTDNNALADFLSVDRILFNETQLLLKDVARNTARIYLYGKVDATIDDVATGLKVSGIFDVDLSSGLVTDVRLNMNEAREAGQVAAGFEGKSKIDIRLTKDGSCKHLSTNNLKQITKSRRIKQKLQWSSDVGKFALQYDPRWRVIAAEQEAAVMRYIDDGDLMAQCDIVQLPSRPANNPLTLAGYKTEVEKIIRTEKSARIVDASEITTIQGLKALKVIVKGEEKSIPVQWIYYHVASKDGRRLTFVFTLEQEIAKVFQPSDQRMVNGLNFFDADRRATVQARQPARKTARRSASGAKAARQR